MMSLTDLRHKINHVVFSNKLYHALIKPFSKVCCEIIPTRNLREERKENLPLNKICQAADLYHAPWRECGRELKLNMDEQNFHRKDWEYTQIIFALKNLRYLTPDSLCLAIGAGREPLLYYLAHKVGEVIGIDLYEGEYYGGEDESDIPLSAERYAPFPYPREKLRLIRMNALDLDFPDDHFDFVFSASSIEHFGRKRDIQKSLQEMYRVLKQGGAALITTELKLTSTGSRMPNVRPFSYREIKDLIGKAGFEAPQDPDLRIEQEYFADWVKLPEEINKRPHVILRFLNTVFTSIHLVLHKPGDTARQGREMIADIPEFEYRGQIEVQAAAPSVAGGADIPLEISLTNQGNFTWIHSGHSHRIAIGAQLVNAGGNLVERDFATILLPQEIKPGETLTFRASIEAPGRPGSWILRFDLKKEMVFWFSEKGNAVFDLPFDVV
jgi:SAM-dependent methyltransferase